jgi:hemerythrin-like domain-containing protein
VRIDRAIQAGEIILEPWQSEIQQLFEQEIAIHFAAEEKELFPVADQIPELKDLVAELLSDHSILREFVSRAADRSLDELSLRKFAELLSTHIRKEERQLFEAMQQRMSSEDMARLGAHLDQELAPSVDACLLPTEATRLRKKD